MQGQGGRIMAESREEKLGITADRFKDHTGYYTQLAEAMGIKWDDTSEKFMGRTLEYWVAKYAEDEYLNNHPLVLFDYKHPFWRDVAHNQGILWAMCDTVCCLKTVIKNKVKEVVG
jgi:hypothetical protein